MGKLGLSLSALFGLSLSCGASYAAVTRLDKGDWVVMAFAMANRAEAVLMNMVAQPGTFAALAREVGEIPGARIVYSHPATEYLTIIVAPTMLERVMTLRDLDALSVENAHANNAEVAARELFPQLPDSMFAAPAATSSATPNSPLPEFPYASADNVLKDLDAADWQRAHPSFDGRGVVIGFVESLPDITAPEFAQAYTLEGRPTRKVIDSVASPHNLFALDPHQDVRDNKWSSFDEAPAGTSLRTGVWRLPKRQLSLAGLEICLPGRSTKVDYRHDIRRSGLEDTHEFKFDWDELTRRARVDTNCNGDLGDERAVGLIGETGQALQLGDTRIDAGLKHSLTVALSREKDFEGLIFQPAVSDHVMVTAGAAVANKDPDGKINGVAPGAAIIFFHHQGSFNGFADALIKVFSDPRTDIVLIESHSWVTELRDVNDGGSALTVFLRRLLERFPKPVFITAGNEMGMSQVSDICVDDLVVCVGAYHSRRTTLSNFGVDTGIEDALGEVGSSGPAADGAIKPDLLAPSNPISLALRYSDGPEYGALPAGLYASKIGYENGGGTSTAAPVAAGAGALLLSAARQSGLKISSRSLMRAMLASARFLKNVQAYDQGRGVIDVAAAFKYLQTHGANEPIEIAIDAPVRAVWSEVLATPNRGCGLFEREGWSVNQRETRKIRVTRRSGPDGDMPVELQWLGPPAGTFSSSRSVLLPLNKAVDLPIDIHPRQVGAHSALLRFVAAGSGQSLAEMGATVIVPETFRPDTQFKISYNTSLEPFGRRSLFFYVPPGTAQLRIVTRQDEDTAQAHLKSPASQSAGRLIHIYTKRAAALSINFPDSGVWEYLVTDRHHAYRYDSTEYGKISKPVRIDSTLSLRSVDAKVSDSQKIVLSNSGSSFSGAWTDSGLAQVRRKKMAIGVVPIAEMIDITAEVESLSIALDLQQGDADAFLFRCKAQGECEFVASSTGHHGSKRIVVTAPAVGQYQAIIAGNAGQAMYTDTVVSKRFGVVSSSDGKSSKPAGESWQPEFCVWNPGAPVQEGTVLAVPIILNFAPEADPFAEDRLLIGTQPRSRLVDSCGG